MGTVVRRELESIVLRKASGRAEDAEECTSEAPRVTAVTASDAAHRGFVA